MFRRFVLLSALLGVALLPWGRAIELDSTFKAPRDYYTFTPNTPYKLNKRKGGKAALLTALKVIGIVSGTSLGITAIAFGTKAIVKVVKEKRKRAQELKAAAEDEEHPDSEITSSSGASQSNVNLSDLKEELENIWVVMNSINQKHEKKFKELEDALEGIESKLSTIDESVSELSESREELSSREAPDASVALATATEEISAKVGAEISAKMKVQIDEKMVERMQSLESLESKYERIDTLLGGMKSEINSVKSIAKEAMAKEKSAGKANTVSDANVKAVESTMKSVQSNMKRELEEMRAKMDQLKAEELPKLLRKYDASLLNRINDAVKAVEKKRLAAPSPQQVSPKTVAPHTTASTAQKSTKPKSTAKQQRPKKVSK
jgi:DNA repair exonuclease SbcCD ATPase subunit